MLNNMIYKIVIFCLMSLCLIRANAQSESISKDVTPIDTLGINVLLNTAKQYKYGINTDVNIKKAIRIYKYLVRKGNTDAMTELGKMFIDGDGVEQNYKRAYFLLKRAAQSNNVRAMCVIAKMYQFGLGVKQNYEKAYLYYFDAMQHGSPEGFYGLGYLTYKGLGTKQNYEKAEIYLRKGSEKGHSGCDFLLGSYYANGMNGTPNYEKAQKHYNMAVKRGHNWTIDLTQYNTLDSIKSKNQSRQKMIVGQNLKELIQKKAQDKTMTTTDLHSLAGRWTGTIYTYDWSYRKIFDQEPITLLFTGDGIFRTMKWINNDTVSTIFTPDIQENNYFKMSKLHKNYQQKKWVVTKASFYVDSDNKLYIPISTIKFNNKEPRKPAIAVLHRDVISVPSQSLKIVGITPLPVKDTSMTIKLYAENDDIVTISIYNMASIKIADYGSIKIKKGINELTINATIAQGKYLLKIVGNKGLVTTVFTHL